MQQDLPLERSSVDERFDLEYPEAELVFGLVFAVGTEFMPALDFLEDKIKLSGYLPNRLNISHWFNESAARLKLQLDFPEKPEFERVMSRISAGRTIARETGRKDVFALMAASKIFATRNLKGGNSEPLPRRAHILVSLKRPEEVETLRRIYGPGFFLVGIFSEEAERLAYLRSRKAFTVEQAARLVEVDQKESNEEFGQRTRDTFEMADVFVGVAGKAYERGLERFLRLVFGDPFVTPTRDEHAMFLAYAASLRSGDLARQVGAALSCASGDVISLGCNDVPSPGGGLYSADHGEADDRDSKRGVDSNDKRKVEIINDIIDTLRNRLTPRPELEAILAEAHPL